MKNPFIFVIVVWSLLLLSWCSSINNDIFDRKVKCYELWRQYINDLENDLAEESTSIYSIDWVYFNNEEKTCFMEYTEFYNTKLWENKSISYIVDILSNNIILIWWEHSTDEYKTMYFEKLDVIKKDYEYKIFFFNKEE